MGSPEDGVRVGPGKRALEEWVGEVEGTQKAREIDSMGIGRIRKGDARFIGGGMVAGSVGLPPGQSNHRRSRPELHEGVNVAGNVRWISF
jgi:hypothetical protein